MFEPKVSLVEHERVVGELRDELAEIREAQDEPNEWIEGVLRKRIIVHLKDSSSIDGSLSATMDDGIVLRAAKLLNQDGSATTMAGEVFIPRENVAFAQLDE